MSDAYSTYLNQNLRAKISFKIDFTHMFSHVNVGSAQWTLYSAVSFVCLFDLILYIPSTIFQLNRDGSSWVEPLLS